MTRSSGMTPRHPSSPMWRRRPGPALTKVPKAVAKRMEAIGAQLELVIVGYQRGALRVFSGVDLMRSPVDKTPTPTWHVSVSAGDGRSSARPVTDAELEVVRRAFGMQAAEEDNHEPGMARHLFLAIDPKHRAACECNVAEVTFIEPDGHRWKAPADQEASRRLAMDLVWAGRR